MSLPIDSQKVYNDFNELLFQNSLINCYINSDNSHKKQFYLDILLEYYLGVNVSSIEDSYKEYLFNDFIIRKKKNMIEFYDVSIILLAEAIIDMTDDIEISYSKVLGCLRIAEKFISDDVLHVRNYQRNFDVNPFRFMQMELRILNELNWNCYSDRIKNHIYNNVIENYTDC
jgi:hypothetical protein